VVHHCILVLTFLATSMSFSMNVNEWEVMIALGFDVVIASIGFIFSILMCFSPIQHNSNLSLLSLPRRQTMVIQQFL
jgi:hypothetical protein